MLFDNDQNTNNWIYWRDWLAGKFGNYRDWTTVAEIGDFDHSDSLNTSESQTILSYLAKNDQRILNQIKSDENLSVQFHRHTVNVNSSETGVTAEFELGSDEEILFVVNKPELYGFPSTWRLSQSFEDYFDLRYDNDAQLVDPRSGDITVRFPKPGDKGPVEIRTDYLQDFLAAFGLVLIRQHDRRRHWTKPIKGIPERGGTGRVIMEEWGSYRIVIYNRRNLGVACNSRLTCKDIILPAKHAGRVGCHSDSGLKPIEYPEFIVERQIDGSHVKEIPDRDKLQLFAFFKPKVLKKYYDEPTKYSVSFGSPGYGKVSDLHAWSMAIGQSDEGLVFCWLSDIAKSFMPYSEVTHWHANNVAPRGKPSRSFILSQVMGEFSKEASLILKLLLCRDQLKKAVDKEGFSLYRPYAGSHCHLEKLLREPLLNEGTEFAECILNLAIMFVDYLDTKSLKESLPVEMTKDNQDNKLSSIALLRNYLTECTGAKEEVITPLIKALQMVQEVRSKSGAAHSFSDRSFSVTLDKLNISHTPTAQSLFLAVAMPLASALEDFCASTENEELLWWRRKYE